MAQKHSYINRTAELGALWATTELLSPIFIRRVVSALSAAMSAWSSRWSASERCTVPLMFVIRASR